MVRIRLQTLKYAPLFLDPRRAFTSAAIAAVWSCYVMLTATAATFDGVMLSRSWLFSWGIPLALADATSLGASVSGSATQNPDFVLYFYAPVLLFTTAFICIFTIALLSAIIRQLYLELELLLSVILIVAQETVSGVLA